MQKTKLCLLKRFRPGPGLFHDSFMSKTLSLRLTILKAHGSKHFCCILTTAAKGCTCWQNCWFPITAGSSHVWHSVLPHHTAALKPSQAKEATLHVTKTDSYQQPAGKSLPILCPQKRFFTNTLLVSPNHFRVLWYFLQHVQQNFHHQSQI